MIIKKGEVERCGHCKIAIKQGHPIYGCDNCGAVIADIDAVLTVKAFWQESIDNSPGASAKNDKYHFCSWYCLLKKLPEIKPDSFIVLPYLWCDKDSSFRNRTMDSLFDAIRRVAKEIEIVESA